MEKLLLTPREAADRLGVSRDRIYQMLNDGTLPGVIRIGKLFRISEESLRQWIADQSQNQTVA